MEYENEPENGFRMSVIEVENDENGQPSIISPNNEIILNISNKPIQDDSKCYNKSIIEIEKVQDEPIIIQRLSSTDSESVIFIFVDSDTKHGRNMLNIGMSKIEYKNKPKCVVYLYDKNDIHIDTAIELLRQELDRGNIYFKNS